MRILLLFGAILTSGGGEAAAQRSWTAPAYAPPASAKAGVSGSFAGGHWRGGGLGRHDRHSRFRHRHSPRDGDARSERGYAYAYGYGYGGLAEDAGAVDPHGTGFFAGSGGDVRVEGGRAVYDYDRAYPYEFASRASGSGWTTGSALGDRQVRCGIESGIRVCRGRR